MSPEPPPPPFPRTELLRSSPYRKEIVQVGPADYESWLNGQFIGSWPTRDQALAEMDRVAYDDATHDGSLATSLTDRLTPFGVPDGPRADVPITAPARRAAFVRFCRAFERSPLILDRAERALQIRADAITTCANGDLQISGASGSHTVSALACSCKDFWVRGASTGDMCKHMIRRELDRLAQELALSGQLNLTDLTTAYVVIPPTQLNRLKLAFGRAQRTLRANSDTQLSLIVANRLLVLWANSTQLASLTGADGDGVSHIAITADHLAQAQAALAAALTRPMAPTVQLLLADGVLLLTEVAVVLTISPTSRAA